MPTLPSPVEIREPAARAKSPQAPHARSNLLRRAFRSSPWLVIALGAHVVAILVLSAVHLVRHDRKSPLPDTVIAVRPSLLELGSEGLPSLELIDRSAIPPLGDDELIDPDAAFEVRDAQGAGGRGSSFAGGRIGHAGRGGGGLAATMPPSDNDATTTWKRSTLVPNTSRLRVGATETLPLESVEASIRVDGPRARVVLDCVYRNDRDRSLEGTFELRLPNEASPFFFAFGESVQTAMPAGPGNAEARFLGATAASIEATAATGIVAAREAAWNAPKEARIVPRERAAWAYTETTRRRVDPALVEWSGAGVFSARVSPLAAGRAHRIVFAYDMDLVQTGDDQELRFDLPPGVPQCAVTVNLDAAVRAKLSPSASPSASGGRALYAYRNPAANAIVLRVANPGSVVLVGTDAVVGPCFATSLRPQLPARAASAQASRAVFLIDTSLSSNPERFGVWLKLVRAILDANRGALREFDVLFFDVQTRWWRKGFAANTPENVTAFLVEAEAMSLEGATDLRAALAEAASPAWDRSPGAGAAGARPDLFLLSDGASTWGAADPSDLDAALARGHAGALWAYETGLAGTDSATLAHLARASGGAVFSVTGDAEIAAAARAHTQRPYRLRSVSVEGGADVLVGGRPTSLHPGQTLRIAGRGSPGAGAPLVLCLEQDGRTFEVRANPSRVVRSDLAARAYGQIAVGQIEEFGAVAGSPARAYATHFGVVGSTCSLLMLESEADYARYGIHPDEDAARIKWELASDFVARYLDARRLEASDARSDLVAWLHRLEAMPGVEFQAPEGLLTAIGRMPAASFRVEAPPLVCARVRRSDVPRAVLDAFASHQIDYAAIATESKRRLSAFGPAEALRAMSSLVENLPGDTALARDVAYSALEWGLPGQAVQLFGRVARLRPYEPETYRAMADALQRAGAVDLAVVYFEIAIAGRFDARFGGFHEVAALDYVRMLRRIERGEIVTSVPDFAAARLAALTSPNPGAAPELVVVITWNTDRTDVDLHVTDPRGEQCWYQNRRTKSGGSMTADVTQGFGPEMFRIANPVPGDYQVRVHYYRADEQRASVRSQVLATVYERWGRPDEKVTRKVLELANGGEQWEALTSVHVAAGAK